MYAVSQTAPLPKASNRHQNYAAGALGMQTAPPGVRDAYRTAAGEIFTRVVWAGNPSLANVVTKEAVENIVWLAAVYGDVFLTLSESGSHLGGGRTWIKRATASMYRIETVKGKVLEFQQGVHGVCYNCVVESSYESPQPLPMCAHQDNYVTRMKPERVVHIRPHRQTVFLYGGTVPSVSAYGHSSLLLGHTEPSAEFVQEVEAGIKDLCLFLKTGNRIPKENQ